MGPLETGIGEFVKNAVQILASPVPLPRQANHRKSEDHWLKVLGGPVPFYKVINVPEPEYSDGATVAQGVKDERRKS